MIYENKLTLRLNKEKYSLQIKQRFTSSSFTHNGLGNCKFIVSLLIVDMEDTALAALLEVITQLTAKQQCKRKFKINFYFGNFLLNYDKNYQ